MLFKILITILLVAYPFIIYFGLKVADIRVVVIALAAILLLRLFKQDSNKMMRLPIVGGLVLMLLGFYH